MSILHFSDIFFPSFRKIFSEKNNYEIANAHLAMGYIGLDEYYNKEKYLIKTTADYLYMQNKENGGALVTFGLIIYPR